MSTDQSLLPGNNPPPDVMREDAIEFLVRWAESEGPDRGPFIIDTDGATAMLHGVSVPAWLMMVLNVLAGHPMTPYAHDRSTLHRDLVLMGAAAWAQILSQWSNDENTANLVHIIRTEEQLRRDRCLRPAPTTLPSHRASPRPHVLATHPPSHARQHTGDPSGSTNARRERTVPTRRCVRSLAAHHRRSSKQWGLATSRSTEPSESSSIRRSRGPTDSPTTTGKQALLDAGACLPLLPPAAPGDRPAPSHHRSSCLPCEYFHR